MHFVGSVPLDTSEEIFRLLATTLPQHIARLPDGEPAARDTFVKWQRDVFSGLPALYNKPGQPALDTESAEVKTALSQLETGYGQAAISSYQTFKTLRDGEGAVIPKSVRFQMCVPTPINTLNAWIAPQYKPFVEPYYAAALQRAIANAQKVIPHADLVVQFDCAHEFGVLERLHDTNPAFHDRRPWWDEDTSEDDPLGPHAKGMIERLISFARAANVQPDVQLGFHLCYGDFGHKHFVEPRDTAIMVRVAREILLRLAPARKVDYIHMPVPKERDDEAYFAPLRELVPLLNKSRTKLFLGLIREADEAGTRRRIETAKRVLGSVDGGETLDWGVASECGMGRTPRSEVPGILEIVKNVSLPLARSWSGPARANV